MGTHGKMYQSALAAITKCHGLGDLNHRNPFSPIAGTWESEIKVLAGLVSSKAFLLGL